MKAISGFRATPGTILYIVDLPIEQSVDVGSSDVDDKSFAIEKDILGSFDILCVFNERMKATIMDRYEIPSDRFVEFEILDHFTSFTPGVEPHRKKTRRTVVYSGKYTEAKVGNWVSDLPRSPSIIYEFTGLSWDWVDKMGRSDVTNRGFLREIELFELLENADFGLIQTSQAKHSEYSNYGSTSKLGTYLIAGLPILVSSACEYISSLVKKYQVGFSFERLSEIATIIETLSDSSYDETRKRSLALGDKIKNGFFFKQALNESLRKLKIS